MDLDRHSCFREDSHCSLVAVVVDNVLLDNNNWSLHADWGGIESNMDLKDSYVMFVKENKKNEVVSYHWERV